MVKEPLAAAHFVASAKFELLRMFAAEADVWQVTARELLTEELASALAVIVTVPENMDCSDIVFAEPDAITGFWHATLAGSEDVHTTFLSVAVEGSKVAVAVLVCPTRAMNFGPPGTRMLMPGASSLPPESEDGPIREAESDRQASPIVSIFVMLWRLSFIPLPPLPLGPSEDPLSSPRRGVSAGLEESGSSEGPRARALLRQLKRMLPVLEIEAGAT
jgi:hypothetical protein